MLSSLSSFSALLMMLPTLAAAPVGPVLAVRLTLTFCTCGCCTCGCDFGDRGGRPGLGVFGAFRCVLSSGLGGTSMGGGGGARNVFRGGGGGACVDSLGGAISAASSSSLSSRLAYDGAYDDVDGGAAEATAPVRGLMNDDADVPKSAPDVAGSFLCVFAARSVDRVADLGVAFLTHEGA